MATVSISRRDWRGWPSREGSASRVVRDQVVDKLSFAVEDLGAQQVKNIAFQLVSRRYERGSLLITSNRAVAEWGTVFGDPVVATAILDHLLHHSHVVTIRGESFRLREKRRSGLPTPVNHHQAGGQRISVINRGVNSSCRHGVSSGCRLTRGYAPRGIRTIPSI